MAIDTDDQSKAFQTCDKMAVLADGKNMAIKSMLHNMQKSMFGTPRAQAELKDMQQKLDNIRANMQDMVVRKNASIEKIKESLIEAAQVINEADSMLARFTKVLKADGASVKGGK